MPPRRPLPDLCLIAIFGQMPLGDQMKASRISPQCWNLVRYANLNVKSLAITPEYGFDNTTSMRYMEDNINLFPVHKWAPSRPRKNKERNGYWRYRLTKWNSLQFSGYPGLDMTAAMEIVALFPSVIEFTFFSWYTDVLPQLVAMLKAEEWRSQLVYFMLVDYVGERDPLISSALNWRLISALNAFEKLEVLFIRLKSPSISILYDLPIAERLKAIGITCSHTVHEAILPLLARSLGSNGALQIWINHKNYSGTGLRNRFPSN